MPTGHATLTLEIVLPGAWQRFRLMTRNCWHKASSCPVGRPDRCSTAWITTDPSVVDPAEAASLVLLSG